MAPKTKGILAVVSAYTIFGLNIVFAKDLTRSGLIGPSGIVFLRLAGACLLFWFSSLFTRREPVRKGDFPRIFLASALGIFVPQMATVWGITMSTPFDASLISTLKPLMTVIVAWVLLGARTTGREWVGIVTSLLGAVLLVFSASAAPYSARFGTTPAGFVVLLTNGLSFAFYLVLFKDLACRYSPVTFMKWMFLFSLLLAAPFSVNQLLFASWEGLSWQMVAELGFMVVFASFVAFFLSPVGQKYLSATHYSLCSYVQLLVAGALGIAMGMESISVLKIVSACIILFGVRFALRQNTIEG